MGAVQTVLYERFLDQTVDSRKKTGSLHPLLRDE